MESSQMNGAKFPLPLPPDTIEVPLSWQKPACTEYGEDAAWIVEATEIGCRSNMTWVFGKPGYTTCSLGTTAASRRKATRETLEPSSGLQLLQRPGKDVTSLGERTFLSGTMVDPHQKLVIQSLREQVKVREELQQIEPDFGRHLCLHRFKLWWLKPSHGEGGVDVPPETSLVLAEHRSNSSVSKRYVVLLPVCDAHARAILHGAPAEGTGGHVKGTAALALSAETGDSDVLLPKRMGILLVAMGHDPFRLVRRLTQEAVGRLRGQIAIGKPEKPPFCLSSASFVDKFGWCTWDSFYTMVTPQGIFEGLSGFSEIGVQPRWVVIDDGWQGTTNDEALNTEQWDERLLTLEANERFRRIDMRGRTILDLGDTVGRLKSDFGVENVLTWHTIVGYWAGVEPEASPMKAFDARITKLVAPKGIQLIDPEMQTELDEKRFGMLPLEFAEDFFRSYHGYLRDNGVSGVKVDAQSILDCMGGGNGGTPAVVRAYHEALAKSVQTAFDGGGRRAPLIHCMCHAPLVLFHVAAVSQDRPLIRGSDDFYPREDYSHGPHLYTNAYNALLISNLGVQDWDMFQSGLGHGATEDSAQASAGVSGLQTGQRAAVATERKANVSWFHAVARAVCGGPVYVSDRVGEHDKTLLEKLVLSDGSILRAATNALPTLDCLMRDPQKAGGGLLQIWALNALPGTGVVASFNIRGAAFSQSERSWVRHEDGDIPAVQGFVSPSDVHAFGNVHHVESSFREDESPQAASQTQAHPSPPESQSRERIYALYLHCRKKMQVLRFRESVPLTLLPLDFELATFSEILELRRPNNGNPSSYVDEDVDSENTVVRWAPLGLADMLNSSAAVRRQEVLTQGMGNNFPRVACSVRGSGRFLAVASPRPTSSVLEAAAGDANEKGNAEEAPTELEFRVMETVSGSGSLCGGGNDGREGQGNATNMHVVEVDIPSPWDGKERRLVFSWD